MATEQQSLDNLIRPTSFDDLIGSYGEVRNIQKLLASGRVEKGWLLIGLPGVGKTTIARIIAHELQGPNYDDPSEIDIIEKNVADETGVDAAREMIANAAYHATLAKWRVYILDEAHKFTEAAQNALLKCVEHNETTVFIFCTTDPGKIIPPIKDRCAATTFRIPELNADGVKKLVDRAVESGTMETKDSAPLVAAILESDIRAPRRIIKAVESWLAGQTPEQCVNSLDTDPDMFEVIQRVSKGDWNFVSKALQKYGPKDCENLIGATTGYLKTMLIGNWKNPGPGMGEKAKLIAEAITILSDINLMTPAKFPATVAALYRATARMASCTK